jgi:shikimate kinase
VTSSDKLVEDAAGGITVQQMFREGNEEEFRNAESEVLMQLSALGRLVVATGGGAVVRPQNWL